jgi:hypothetical protein
MRQDCRHLFWHTIWLDLNQQGLIFTEHFLVVFTSLLVDGTVRYYHQYLDTLDEGHHPLSDVIVPDGASFVPNRSVGTWFTRICEAVVLDWNGFISVRIRIHSVITLCSLIGRYQCFWWMYFLHLHIRSGQGLESVILYRRGKETCNGW